jgi:hypothetical protein
MADYQIDTSSYQSNNNSELRVGHEGEVAKFHAKGGFAFSMVGTVGRDSYQMKLPAPWTRFRYKLEQDKRVLATASKPKVRGSTVTFELELPGRKLTFVSEDRHGLRWVLNEGGTECGSYDQREFGDQEEWSADFHAPRDWSVPLAAFVAWLKCEAPEGNVTAP